MKLLSATGRIFSQVHRFWRGETSLEILGLKEFLLGVAMISLVRAALDMAIYMRMFSVTVLIAVFLLWFFYILSLCLSTGFLLSWLVPKSDFKQILTMSVSLYWLIPLVPLFSLTRWEKAWGLGIFASTPYFSWIPTFMIQRTYLPLGMLVVIPVIVVMANRFLVQSTGAKWMRTFLVTLMAYGVIYVYYYQWSQRALVTALFDKGLSPWDALLASYIAYSFLTQLITFLLSPVIAKAYKEYPLWVYLVWTGVPLVVFFLIPHIGFFSLFLAAGRRF